MLLASPGHPEPMEVALNAHTDPAQLAVASTPLRPMAEWICDGPTRVDARDLVAMNKAAKATIGTTIEDPGGNLRMKYRNFVDRSLMFHLDQREYIILMAIITRTAPFGTFVDTIPLSQFKDGLRDGSGKLSIDTATGMPFFEGTNLSYGTIRAATASLAKKGLISIFSIPQKGTKDVYAYSFMSLRSMYAAALQFDVAEANTFSRSFRGEELLLMSVFRASVSELDHRCTAMFPDGFKHIMAKRKEYTEDLAQMYRENFEINQPGSATL